MKPYNSHRRNYSIISELDVVNVILRTAESWEGCGVITPSNIASLLRTSRYQVNKHIKALKQRNLLEYKCVDISTYEELYPPVNGYCLSKTGKEFYKKELEEIY